MSLIFQLPENDGGYCNQLWRFLGNYLVAQKFKKTFIFPFKKTSSTHSRGSFFLENMNNICYSSWDICIAIKYSTIITLILI